MVSTPSRRDSSRPVPSVSASGSKIRSDGSRPYRSTARSWIAFAERSFHSAVRAWPSSSMQVHTTAAPYSLASDRKRSSRVPGSAPSSRLTELRIARPPRCCSAVSTTSGSVESIMSGTVDWVEKRLATSSMSALPSRPT